MSIKKSGSIAPTVSQATKTVETAPTNLTFGKKNFGYLMLGIGLIALGYMLMAGGHMPSREVWDESLIYSARRTVVAPILILAGLAVQVYAIFAKK